MKPSVGEDITYSVGCILCYILWYIILGGIEEASNEFFYNLHVDVLFSVIYIRTLPSNNVV